ncbi:MAG: DUF4855 domain-containing protein [Kiritimatiellae bacterium]|nr:DUF4855 domain-containing protein [Kiritimatiellia bacterium]
MSQKKISAIGFLVSVLYASAGMGGYCPPQSRQSDGMRDIMLIYAGTNHWRPENFLPYVSYVDREGKPRDWFYDAYLFLMFSGGPSGVGYSDGATNRKDWDFYLDEEFAPGREFAALNTAIENAARQMAVKAPTVPVIAMIPYPSVSQKDFGDVDGDGVTENLAVAGEREKVVSWFLRAFIERWGKAKFPHLKLWGFYWMNEGIAPPDEAIVKAAARKIHALGYKFHWIPWFKAPGVEKWRDFGLDLAIMQPNYAFIPPAGQVQVPDENRLTTAANMCRRLGMGIEIELNMFRQWEPGNAAPMVPRDRINLQLYLDHGDDALDGYQAGAVRAYYQSYHAIAGLCASSDPAARQLYDDLYHFHKGTYTRRRPYQPVNAPEKCLTDGRWKTRPDSKADAVTLTGPQAVLTLPLGGLRLVSDVRVHFAGDTAPQRVTLALSSGTGSDAFTEVADDDYIVPHPEDGGGFAVLTFPARLARHMRLSFKMEAGGHAAVDEILLMPASHLLCGVPCRADAGAVDLSNCLTDGVTGGDAKAEWRNGRGEAHVELPEAWYAESLLVHFRQLHKKKFAPHAVVGNVAGTHPADKDGWAVVPLNRPVQKIFLSIEDVAAGVVSVDEVALLPAKNLAAGCSYTYDPPFHATYPDAGGRELTDGEVSQGFGDGKTAGWEAGATARDVTVVVDTGASRAIEMVEAHVQGGGSASVEFPERVAIAVSEDGKQWTRVTASGGEPAEKESREINGRISALGWLRFPTPGARGRHIQLRILPKGWLMLSEVRVLSGGVNVALNRPYSITPQPTGREPYADNSGLLTDGYYTKAGTGWTTCAGFSTADPTVVLDLDAVYRIGTARVHLQGGGTAGVVFPRQVSVSTSVDGKTWSPAGETREFPAEKNKLSATAFMGVTFEPREARFVRFHVQRRGWVMLDEIEIFPAD